MADAAEAPGDREAGAKGDCAGDDGGPIALRTGDCAANDDAATEPSDAREVSIALIWLSVANRDFFCNF